MERYPVCRLQLEPRHAHAMTQHRGAPAAPVPKGVRRNPVVITGAWRLVCDADPSHFCGAQAPAG